MEINTAMFCPSVECESCFPGLESELCGIGVECVASRRGVFLDPTFKSTRTTSVWGIEALLLGLRKGRRISFDDLWLLPIGVRLRYVVRLGVGGREIIKHRSMCPTMALPRFQLRYFGALLQNSGAFSFKEGLESKCPPCDSCDC